MKAFHMTHDLSCTLGQLATAACRYHDMPTYVTSRPGRDLALAAVAFTIQLTIDSTDRDPAEMRSLERALLALFADE
jgi:hypothetical protein